MLLYPLKFEPVYKPRIWGGDKLRTLYNRDLPAGQRIAESWELTDLPCDKSVVANGELAGQRIDELMRRFGKDITGGSQLNGSFPLMVKFLDVTDTLSIQVHPDSHACMTLGQGVAKTECWYIVHADKDAVIYNGLRETVTKAQFAQAVKQGKLLEVLDIQPVQPGACYYIPAGMVHGISPSVLIAEVETPSDTTFRIFDWDRKGPDGKPRDLHIKHAIESIHFGQKYQPARTVGRLVDCEFFKLDKGHQARDCQVFFSAGQMRVLIILSGHGIVTGRSTPPVEFEAGRTILIPAAFEGVAIFHQDCQYLTVTL